MPVFQQNEPVSAAIAKRISPNQPNYFRGYRVDRRLYSKIPIRSCDIVRRGNDWRVLAAICATASPLGICYASQRYLGELAGGLDPASVSRAVKHLHKSKLIRLLLPKGRPYPGRFQRGNRYQVLYQENAPLPSKNEIELQWGARTARW